VLLNTEADRTVMHSPLGTMSTN